MSNPKVRHADVKLFLPKKGNSIISKTFDVCIEDFLEKLNVNAEKVEEGMKFLEAPGVLIGNHRVSLGISQIAGSIKLSFEVEVTSSLGAKFKERNMILMEVKVEGICGNAPVSVKGEVDIDQQYWVADVELEKMEHLKDAMITSGSHKLDLHVDLLIEETEWIMTR